MFKIGDKVRLTKDMGPSFRVGTEGKIVDTSYSFIWPYKVLLDSNLEIVCTRSEIELINVPVLPSGAAITRRFYDRSNPSDWVILEQQSNGAWRYKNSSNSMANIVKSMYTGIDVFLRYHTNLIEDGHYAIWGAPSLPSHNPMHDKPDRITTTEVISNKCNHQWKRYIGFTHIYDFCTQCPSKRDIAS